MKKYISNNGRRLLIPVIVASLTVCSKNDRLDSFTEELEQNIKSLPNKELGANNVCIAVLESAISAYKDGNYGIGACIWNKKTQEIVICGENKVFSPYFRSDQHAEMDTINKYESKEKSDLPNVEDFVLYTSLEPCPMCLTRTITAGFNEVRYMARDELGGMVSRLDKLPPIWKDLSKARKYLPAECDVEYVDLAMKIFSTSREELDNKLRN